MEVGLGKNGTFDCSGLVINAMSKVLGRSMDAWPRELRHTRQMVHELEMANEPEKLLEEVDSGDVGDLIFTRRLFKSGWGVSHVGILTGFNEHGQPIRLESTNRENSSVVECELPEPRFVTERFVLSSSALAGLAVAQTANLEPVGTLEF